MLISTDDLDWQAELGHANRAFAAMIGGQLYENIPREEARRLGQLTEHAASFKDYPPIPPGTPDPYEPPS